MLGLRDYRVRRGITIKTLADKLGVTAEELGNYESRKEKIPKKVLLKYCSIFSIGNNEFVRLLEEYGEEV